MGTHREGKKTDLRPPFLPYHLFFPHLPTPRPHPTGEPLSRVDLVQVRLCQHPAVGPEASPLMSWSLSFLVYKREGAVPTFQGGCVDIVYV